MLTRALLTITAHPWLPPKLWWTVACTESFSSVQASLLLCWGLSQVTRVMLHVIPGKRAGAWCSQHSLSQALSYWCFPFPASLFLLLHVCFLGLPPPWITCIPVHPAGSATEKTLGMTSIVVGSILGLPFLHTSQNNTLKMCCVSPPTSTPCRLLRWILNT